MMGVEMGLNPCFQFILVGMEGVLVSNMKSNSTDRLVKLGKLKTTVHNFLVLDVIFTVAQ